jgi:hypothetical protein
MTDPTTRFALADVLEQLGSELREAARRGERTLQWMSAEVEMDVELEVTGSAGVRFWVVDASADVARRRSTRIKVTLTPHSDFQQPDGVGM